MPSVAVNVLKCVTGRGIRGQWGLGKGLKMGQLTLSMGPVWVEVGFFVQRNNIPRKRVNFFIYIYHTCY